MRFAFITYISYPSLGVAAKGFMGKVKTRGRNLTFLRIPEKRESTINSCFVKEAQVYVPFYIMVTFGYLCTFWTILKERKKAING